MDKLNIFLSYSNEKADLLVQLFCGKGMVVVRKKIIYHCY